jgi:hypothetical protein
VKDIKILKQQDQGLETTMLILEEYLGREVPDDKTRVVRHRNTIIGYVTLMINCFKCNLYWGEEERCC